MYIVPRNQGFLGHQHSPTHLFLKGEYTKLRFYFQTPNIIVIHGNPNPWPDDPDGINIFLLFCVKILVKNDLTKHFGDVF